MINRQINFTSERELELYKRIEEYGENNYISKTMDVMKMLIEKGLDSDEANTGTSRLTGSISR